RWTRVSEDGNRLRIRVTLPDALQGELRPLRLEGLLPRRPNATVVIPQVELADAAFLGGRHTVTLLRPLQLTSIRMTGCREAAAVTPTNEGDTYQFQQFLPDALLTMEVRRPTSQLNVLTLSAVTFREEEWQQRTDMLWNALNGSAFQVGIQIPSDWEVTDVDALTASGSSDPVNWDLHDDTDGRRLLQVEFLEAITPTAPRTVRLLMRQRRSTETRTVAFPAPRPLDVAASENVLVLQGEGMYRIGLPPGPAMTPVTPAALSENWQALPLWSTLLRDEERHPAVWTRVEGSELSMTAIAMEQEPQPAQVIAKVEVQQRADTLEEAFDLLVTPEEARLFDRMLVYLNEAGGEVTWQVIGPAEHRLVASRLPADQHALWKLPATGELWEIRLPEGAVAEWHLRGKRHRAIMSPVRIGLVHMPQAIRFRGDVIVREDASSALMTWNARGLREVENTVDDGSHVRRWEYSRLSADLSGTTMSPSQRAVRMIIEGQLTSTLSAVANAEDVHRLRLTLRGVTRPFTLILPEEAEWVLATINGETIPAEGGRDLHLAVIASDEPQVVEWVYRVKPQSTNWGTRRRVPWPSGLPDSVWTRFEWTLQGPPQTHLDATCSGLRSVDPVAPVHWRQRLFGPLARSESSPLFLPWQRDGWRQWLEPSATGTVAGQSSPPMDGSTRRFLGPMPPTDFLVDVIDLRQMRILAWSTMISGALLVLVLRATRWGLRDRFVLALITGMCALSFFWSQPWVDVSGGAIIGMVIGGLLPRRWWQPTPALRAPAENVPGGSTQSFVFPQPATMFLLCCLGTSLAWAAEMAPGVRGEITVYVPVDADGKPSQRLPFVYLSPNTLKQLRAMVPHQDAAAPDMLIERADYQVTVGPESRASFSVSYRLLTPRYDAVVCDLPLPSVTLSGPQSCLLDGQPAAVSALPGKRGLRIPIPAASSAVSAIHATEFTTHELTLDFDHPWRRHAAGGTCELSLPQTAWTRVEVQGLIPTSDVQWDGVAGGWERSLDRRQAVVDLGAVDHFDMSWHDRATVENQPPVALRVTTAESLDVSAAAIEVRCRSTVTPTTEPFSRFAWEFPADTNFQNLQVRPAGRAEITTLKTKAVRVDVEFYEPVHDAAVLEADFVCRHSPLQGEFTWRGVRALEPTGIQLDRVQRYWSLTSVPEIRVQPQSVENSGLVPVVADSVRDLFTGLTSHQLSQSPFQVGTDSPVAFRWTTVAPKRRLLLWQQRGEIVGTRLNWSVEADLECTVSPPAYSHTLLVDRRLQIDQISVRERGAERLLRWTELRPSGSPQARVTLWLTDPCLETQRITVTAHMPLSASGSLTLPNVRCEDADLVGGRWELQSIRELRGTWQSLRGLKSLSSTDDRLDASQHWIFEQTDTEPRAVLRLSPRGQSGGGRALYLLSPVDGGRVQLRTRWEMSASDALAGMQFLVPPPWKLARPPAVTGAAQESLQESERGSVMSIAVQPGPSPVTVELLLHAQRSDFAHRHMIFPQLSVDPGLVSWIAEAVPKDGPGILDGLKSGDAADGSEWIT
ncbi:MAG TPA: hypothetical protein VFG20_04715, partial [Planctomycetaceae bacterium]|nr:hypothetical protein [Planctomycetaceae bacterium]